jgi:hypothetical protein
MADRNNIVDPTAHINTTFWGKLEALVIIIAIANSNPPTRNTAVNTGVVT